jgi:hypothetical protein
VNDEARTRALIAGRLGVAIALRRGDAYRDARSLELAGDWLGGFAQPGVILNAVTAVSARLSDDGGAMIDEYGESRLSVARDGDRIQLDKRYGPEATRRFHYVGQLAGGTLAGYWCSPLRPEFGGVFWLVRADQLEQASASALAARVRSSSPRRLLALGTLFGLMIAAGAGIALWNPALAGGALLGQIAFSQLLRSRTRAMLCARRSWQDRLGPFVLTK